MYNSKNNNNNNEWKLFTFLTTCATNIKYPRTISPVFEACQLEKWVTVGSFDPHNIMYKHRVDKLLYFVNLEWRPS